MPTKLLPEATEASRRGWEHAYLESLLDRHELRLKGLMNPVSKVAFHPGGQSLASLGMDLNLFLWSVPEGREIWTVTVIPKRSARSPGAPTASDWPVAAEMVHFVSGTAGTVMSWCRWCTTRSVASARRGN